MKKTTIDLVAGGKGEKTTTCRLKMFFWSTLRSCILSNLFHISEKNLLHFFPELCA